MRGSLLESDKPHQDVASLDKQADVERKLNHSNEHQPETHQNLPGPSINLNHHHNRQV